MSDFMRSVVNEILEKNRYSTLSNPSVPSQKRGPARDVSYGSPVDLKDIKRPNYQKEKMKQRLSPIMEGDKDFSGRTNASATREQTSPPQGPMTKSFVENSLSSLQKLSLRIPSMADTPSSSAKAESAQFLGKTKDGSIVWLFPRLHEGLSNYLALEKKKSDAIGIVASHRISPGQLFLIDEVMKEVPHLAYNVETWKTDEFPFVFLISGSNPDEIHKVLKDIFVRFNRRAIQGITAYFNAFPTRFLVQNLRLENQEAVAVLEGVSTFDSIGLLDRLFKQKSHSRIRFQIKSEYLLLQGEPETVKGMISHLKQDADWLFTD